MTLLGVFLISPVQADWTPEPRWAEDGWQTAFGDAHCYLAQSYHDRSRAEIGITNINFIQVANQRLAELKYSFPLWNALKSVGIEEDELVFTIALPGRVNWVGDVLPIFAASIEVNGVEAKKIDMKPFFDDWETQVWFVVRAPESEKLIEAFSAEEAVQFEVTLIDDSVSAFEYHSSPDLDFKVRRAMFEACLETLSSDIPSN
jgi:hypothetical protein